MKRRARFLPADERAALLTAVGGDDGPAARRANALLLLDRGKPVRFVAEALFLDPATVRGWLEAHRAASPPPPGAGGAPDAQQAPDGTGPAARRAKSICPALAAVLCVAQTWEGLVSVALAQRFGMERESGEFCDIIQGVPSRGRFR